MPSKKRPIMLAEKTQADDEISPLQFHRVQLDSHTMRSFSKLLCPKPKEIAEALKKFIYRKNWTHEMTAAYLNIGISTMRKILNENSCNDGATARLIWLVCQLDYNADLLKNPLFVATWGKSKGLFPQKDQPKKKLVGKRKVPYILRPTKPWVYVDWSRPDQDIADVVKYSVETVEWARRRLKKLPRTMLVKYFGAVGRVRQVGILLRGVDRRSIEKLKETALKEALN